MMRCWRGLDEESDDEGGLEGEEEARIQVWTSVQRFRDFS